MLHPELKVVPSYLAYGFVWEKTLEGDQYWRDVNQAMRTDSTEPQAKGTMGKDETTISSPLNIEKALTLLEKHGKYPSVQKRLRRILGKCGPAKKSLLLCQ